MFVSNQELTVLISADTYNSTQELAGVDLSNYEGNLLLHINAAVSTAGTAINFALQHNTAAAAADAGWEDVPAAFITDQVTGSPVALSALTGAAGTKKAQTAEISRSKIKRYLRLRVTFTGGSAGEIFAGVVGQKKY